MPPKSVGIGSVQVKGNSWKKKDLIEKITDRRESIITEKQKHTSLENVALDWHDKMNDKKSRKSAAQLKRAITLQNRKERTTLHKEVPVTDEDITLPSSGSSTGKTKLSIGFRDEVVTKLVTTENLLPDVTESKSNSADPSQTATISSVTFSISSAADTTSQNHDEECRNLSSTSSAGLLEESSHIEDIRQDTKRRKLELDLTILTTEKDDNDLNEMVELPIICGHSPSRLIPSSSALYFSKFEIDEMNESNYDATSKCGNLYDTELEDGENREASKEIRSCDILLMQSPVCSDATSSKVEGIETVSNTFESVVNDNNPGAFSKPPQGKRKYKKRIKVEGSNDLTNGTERKASKGRKGSRTDDNSESCDEDSCTQQHAHGPWADIYAKVKLFVCMAPRNLSNSDVMIRHANEDFFINFGFDKASSLPMPLKSLFGHGTSRMVLHKLHMALLTGKQAYEFINLYRVDKRPLACHIVLVSITGNRMRDDAQQGQSGPPNLELQSLEKYAILTIRSASVIGNAKAYGIGFFGPGRITTVRPPADNALNEKQSAGARVQKEQHGHERNGVLYANCANSSEDEDSESLNSDGNIGTTPILEYHPHHWSGYQPSQNPISYLYHANPQSNQPAYGESPHLASAAYGHMLSVSSHTMNNNSSSNNNHIINNNNSSSSSSMHHGTHPPSLMPHNRPHQIPVPPPQHHSHHYTHHHQYHAYHDPQTWNPHPYQSQSSQQFQMHLSHSHVQHHPGHYNGSNHHSNDQQLQLTALAQSRRQPSFDSESDDEDHQSNHRLSYHRRERHAMSHAQQSIQPHPRSRQTSIIAQESLRPQSRPSSGFEPVVAASPRDNSSRMRPFHHQHHHHHPPHHQQQVKEYGDKF